jgi:hypothetical protein
VVEVDDDKVVVAVVMSANDDDYEDDVDLDDTGGRCRPYDGWRLVVPVATDGCCCCPCAVDGDPRPVQMTTTLS